MSEFVQSVKCPCCDRSVKLVRDADGSLRLEDYPLAFDAFKALADAAGGRWDDVDADEYVRQLRSDD